MHPAHHTPRRIRHINFGAVVHIRWQHTILNHKQVGNLHFYNPRLVPQNYIFLFSPKETTF